MSWTRKGANIISDETANDLGRSIALNYNGSIIAVGAEEDSTNSSRGGAIYVYNFQNDDWVHTDTLFSTNSSREFGYHVAISADGNTIAGTHVTSGYFAIVYKYDGSQWINTNFSFTSPSNGHIEISSDGTIVMIGGGGGGQVFQLINGTWAQIGQNITNENGFNSYETAAMAITSNGMTIVSVNSRDPAVWARVFTFNGSEWVQKGNSIAREAETDEGTDAKNDGLSVAINDAGDKIVIGAGASSGQTEDGVWTYQYDATINSWISLTPLLSGLYKRFGFRVSLNGVGDKLAVGEFRWGQDNHYDIGAAHIYTFENGNWTLTQTMSSEYSNDSFAHAVVLSKNGGVLAIGAPEGENGYGSAERPFPNKGGYAVAYETYVEPPAPLVIHPITATLGSIEEIGSITLTPQYEMDEGHTLVSAYATITSDDSTKIVQFAPSTYESGVAQVIQQLEIGKSYSIVITHQVSTLVYGGYTVDTNVIETTLSSIGLLSDGSWVEKGSVILREDVYDNLGHAIALNKQGNVLAIGGEYTSTKERIYIYYWSNGEWVESEIISTNKIGDEKDFSLSINDAGTVIAVGHKDSNALQIYRFDGRIWNDTLLPAAGFVWSLEFPSASSSARAKTALNASGNRVAIGEYENDSVRVFEYSNDVWSQLGATITADANSTGSSKVGTRVALNALGDTLAELNGTNPEHWARVFTYDGTNWVQKGSSISGIYAGFYGASISLSDDGNRLAIGYGAYSSDETLGGVWTYQYVAPNWVPLAPHIPSPNQNQVGYDVDMNGAGDRLVVGAPEWTPTNGHEGYIYVYALRRNGWVLQHSVEGNKRWSVYGRAVSMSADGRTISAAGPGAHTDNQTGYVQSYTLDGSFVSEHAFSIVIENENSIVTPTYSVESDHQITSAYIRLTSSEGGIEYRDFDLSEYTSGVNIPIENVVIGRTYSGVVIHEMEMPNGETYVVDSGDEVSFTSAYPPPTVHPISVVVAPADRYAVVTPLFEIDPTYTIIESYVVLSTEESETLETRDLDVTGYFSGMELPIADLTNGQKYGAVLVHTVTTPVQGSYVVDSGEPYYFTMPKSAWQPLGAFL